MKQAGEPLPRPGRLSAAGRDDGRVGITLPKAGERVTKRTLYLEVGIYGTRTESPDPAACQIVCDLPEGVRVAAFIVDEAGDGTRSEASPVAYFWVGD